MKTYVVTLPFSGSLSVTVKAENEDEALIIGELEIANLSDEYVLSSIEFDRYDIYER